LVRPEESARSSRAPRRPADSWPTLIVIDGPIERADIPDLERRVRSCLGGPGDGVVDCDVGLNVNADAVIVDVLARVQLLSGRLGRRFRLRQASDELLDLLAFVGLSDMLPPGERSEFGLEGQAEEREPARGVKEEADPGDPPL
jgi:hypothetical protein